MRGRCRACGSAISLQYPIVEGVTGVIFAFFSPLYSAAQHFPFPIGVLLLADYLTIASLLIAIAVYDLRTTYIPDTWVYACIALAFVSQFLTSLPQFDLAVVLLSGPAAAVLLFLVWFVSKGRWMGLGDVKLALGIGYLLGPLYGFIAVMFAFVLGAVVSLLILLPLPAIARFLSDWGIAHIAPSQSYTMKSEIPFGPFLIASCIFVWFTQIYGIPLPLFP